MGKFFLIGLAFLISGCNTSYKVTRLHSAEGRFLIQRMRNSTLESDEKHSWTNLQFNAQVENKEGKSSYSLVAEYSGEKWLFIEPGRSLIITVDGEQLFFEGEGSIGNRTLESGLVVERVWYFLDKEVLRKISFCKQANLKIIGNAAAKTFSLNVKNINNLRRFYNEYVNLKEES